MTVENDTRKQQPPRHPQEREDLHTLWLEKLHGWLCTEEQELLGRMLYKELFTRGVLKEDSFGFKVETLRDGTMQELRHGHNYDYGNLPSLWYSEFGLCWLIEKHAKVEGATKEQFIESLFEAHRAEQILRKLFRNTLSTAKSPPGN